MVFSRTKHFFRSGHISMLPGLKLTFLIGAFRVRLFPWQVPDDTKVTDTSTRHSNSTSVHTLDTFNGSAAIAAMVADMGLGTHDSVLLPAYCCGAELGPFRHAGCSIHLYDVNPDLSINREQIEHIVAEQSDIRALFITHYFGIAQPETASIAQWCRHLKIVLVEDCAHALYSQVNDQPLGVNGDYAVFSPRKSMPITEGGMLVSRKVLEKSTIDRMTRPVPLLPRWERLCYSLQQGARSRPGRLSLHDFGSIIVIAMTVLPSVLIKLARSRGKFHQHHWLTPEVEGEEAVPVYPVRSSALSRKLMCIADAQTIIRTRRENYAYWLKCIQGVDQLNPLIPLLPKGSCPLYFPVIVSDPAMCVQVLAQADIEAFNWWQYMPEELFATGQHSFPVARRLKKSVIALPVHQFVTCSQIDRMARTLVTAVSNATQGT